MRQIFNKLDVSSTMPPTTTAAPFDCATAQASYATNCKNRNSAAGALKIAQDAVAAAQTSIDQNATLRTAKFQEKHNQDATFTAQQTIITDREADNKAKQASIDRNQTTITNNQTDIAANKIKIEDNQKTVNNQQTIINKEQAIIDDAMSTKTQRAEARTKKQSALKIQKPARDRIQKFHDQNVASVNANDNLKAVNIKKSEIIVKNNAAIATATTARNEAAAAVNKLNGEILAIDLAQTALRKTIDAAATDVTNLTADVTNYNDNMQKLAADMLANTCTVTPCI